MRPTFNKIFSVQCITGDYRYNVAQQISRAWPSCLTEALHLLSSSNSPIAPPTPTPVPSNYHFTLWFGVLDYVWYLIYMESRSICLPVTGIALSIVSPRLIYVVAYFSFFMADYTYAPHFLHPVIRDGHSQFLHLGYWEERFNEPEGADIPSRFLFQLFFNKYPEV